MQTLLSERDWDNPLLGTKLHPVLKNAIFDGEMQRESFHADHPVLKKTLGYPIAIISFEHRSSVLFRRSRAHIRRDNSGIRIITHVVKGSCSVTTSAGSNCVNEGEVYFLDSDTPFVARQLVNDSGVHESRHVVVPAPLFLRRMPEFQMFSGIIRRTSPSLRTIHSLIDLLILEGDNIGRSTVEALAVSLLESIKESMADDIGQPIQQDTDHHLERIVEFISNNITDPNLCSEKIAEGCGISSRYLWNILKKNETSLSEMIWIGRINLTREWLCSTALKEKAIYEIAEMAGFKNPAHFSRMFKNVFGMSPKDLRRSMLDGNGSPSGNRHDGAGAHGSGGIISNRPRSNIRLLTQFGRERRDQLRRRSQ